jgi:cytochrome c oxidase cbb3-type subunit III
MGFNVPRARRMPIDQTTAEGRFETGSSPQTSRLIILAIVGLLVGGFIAYRMLSKPADPAPPEVASDPLLNQGWIIYQARCVACHGNAGRGDGPLATQLSGPPVGNLTDDVWKHGARPEQVLSVISKGVPDTRMEGWGRVLDPPEVKAVAAYVYFLAKRAVPEEIRRL